jgi:hypothetical protein
VKLYITWEAFKDACQAWVKDHGYALVVRDNATPKGCPLTLKCDRAKRYRKAQKAAEILKRNVITMKCKCRFTIRGRRQANGMWKVCVSVGKYTDYKAFQHPSVHPVHRRAAMQALNLDKIDGLLKVGVPPRTIISSI